MKNQSNSWDNTVAGQLFILFLILTSIFVILPFTVIWALNTLFLLSIEYSFANFIAVLFIKYGVFSSVRVTNFNDLKNN